MLSAALTNCRPVERRDLAYTNPHQPAAWALTCDCPVLVVEAASIPTRRDSRQYQASAGRE